MSVSEKSNIGNSYYTKLVLGPGTNKNYCQKMHSSQICLLAFELPSPPIVITMGNSGKKTFDWGTGFRYAVPFRKW